MIFKNRQEAGKKLARLLLKYEGHDTVVLALPRGGVVVGYEVARCLKAPLDIVVPRKIGAPGNSEYAIGAIAENGDGVFNPREVESLDSEWLSEEIAKEKKEAARRLRLYRGQQKERNLENKNVILVDDGIATGYTMRAAVKYIKSKNPRKIIVAVPHGAKDSVENIKKEVDEVIVVEIPEWYGAVGSFYQEFQQTTDEEVVALLKKNKEGSNSEEKNSSNYPPSENFKKIILAVAALALILAGAFLNELYLPHADLKETKEIEVLPGLGSREIGSLLKKGGIIRSKWVFVSYVSLTGAASDLKPGLYTFTKKSIPEITKDLVKGTNYEKTITILEGWSISDIEEYLIEEGLGQRESLSQFISSAGAKKIEASFAYLKNRPEGASLEGYLFPDTYRVFSDATNEDMIRKMLTNFGRKVAHELLMEITKQKKSLFQIITMASLIEEEVRTDEDRALVSGILWKRLEIGIPLQVDATVHYAKSQITNSAPPSPDGSAYGKQDKSQTDRKISITDTKIDSLYNTYKYRGLPPGPIASPGLSAIKAAIYSKKSPYFYYLSASLDGQTIFSRTLEEHNIAKAKYLK